MKTFMQPMLHFIGLEVLDDGPIFCGRAHLKRLAFLVKNATKPLQSDVSKSAEIFFYGIREYFVLDKFKDNFIALQGAHLSSSK